MTDSTAFSVLALEPGLARYVKEIVRLPMLGPREEYILAKRWCEQTQKKVLFNLRKLKAVVSALPDGNLLPEQVLTAGRLGVPKHYVVDMNRPLGGDVVLNGDPGGHDACAWQEWPPEDAPSQERPMIESESFTNRRAALRESLSVLDGQEHRSLKHAGSQMSRVRLMSSRTNSESPASGHVKSRCARSRRCRMLFDIRGATAKRPELYDALAQWEGSPLNIGWKHNFQLS